MKQHLRTLPLALSLLASTLLHAQDCFYTLRMFADDGNGWGGSYVTVCVGWSNPFDCNNHTLTDGSFAELDIPVNIGQVIFVTYTAVGGDQNAILYQIVQFGGGHFHSNSPPVEGPVFAMTSDCIPPPALQTDCVGSFTYDILTPFNHWNTYDFSGFHVDLDTTNQGCLENGENNGVWYTFSAYSWQHGTTYTGAYAFSITPHPNHPADYDFALWGPYHWSINLWDACPPPGPPIRCSFASTIGSTGLSAFATDEWDTDGDGWATPITVDGTGYYLLYAGRKDQGAVNFTFTPSFPTSVPSMTRSGTFTLHPNPAHDRTTITLPDLAQGTVFLDLHDAAGRRVMQQQFAAGGSTFDLDLHAIQPGAYLLHLHDAQGLPMGSTRLLKH